MYEMPFVSPKNAKQSMHIPKPNHIEKIGEFVINGHTVISDGYWRKIDLRSGIYEAYRIDDNLLIINKDLSIKPNKNITSWTWKNSGTGVDIESGSFGFYDLAMIKKLSKHKNNKIPEFNFNIHNIDQMSKGLLISTAHLLKLKKEIANDLIFGVVASTQVGDGGFNVLSSTMIFQY